MSGTRDTYQQSSENMNYKMCNTPLEGIIYLVKETIYKLVVLFSYIFFIESPQNKLSCL